MDKQFFRQQESAMRAAFAEGVGCDPAAFADERLTIVERPASAPWRYICGATTFGTGTVLSVDPEYRAFIEQAAPAKHYRAFYAVLMQAIVDEGARRGVKLAYQTPMLSFALGAPPRDVAAPDDFDLRQMEADWMAETARGGGWENGLGDAANSESRAQRNRFATVLFDRNGEIAAVGGAFTTYSLYEIGVDVRRDFRGQGLAPVVVQAAAAEILRLGEVPLYGCAATNIRSQRTAMACGFVPVCSDAWVFPSRD